MLEPTKYVVKEHSKTYDIIDGDSGTVLATARENRGFMGMVVGLIVGQKRRKITIEVRDKSSNELLFSVRRTGMLFKKVRVYDAEGEVIGLYKSKMFSLAGGFHIYDKAGKHFAEIKGKMLKTEYTFLTPDRATEMGKVSKQWGGMARELFTSKDTFGVQIGPKYAEDVKVKMLILGAALAIDAIFGKGGGGSGGGSEEAEVGASSSEDE